jgi:hypothetical protein
LEEGRIEGGREGGVRSMYDGGGEGERINKKSLGFFVLWSVLV